MARRHRRILPGVLQFITVQCFQGRYLLRPSEYVNLLFIGVMAMAQREFPEVRVSIVSALSNHYHSIIWAPTGDMIAGFMNYVNSCAAREVGRQHDWEGRFWHARYSNENILDEEAQIERLEYALAQGCKEGLVHDPRLWPGVQCAKALTTGTMKLKGLWVDRTRLARAEAKERKREREGKPRRKLSEKDFTEEVELQLSPIPAWAHLSVEEYADKCLKLVRGIMRKYKAQYGRFLGAQKVKRQDPHYRPDERTRGKQPPCHAEDTEVWLHFVNENRTWVAQYRAASNGRQLPQDLSDYPSHCFLPGGFYHAG